MLWAFSPMDVSNPNYPFKRRSYSKEGKRLKCGMKQPKETLIFFLSHASLYSNISSTQNPSNSNSAASLLSLSILPSRDPLTLSHEPPLLILSLHHPKPSPT